MGYGPPGNARGGESRMSLGSQGESVCRGRGRGTCVVS